MSTDQPAHVPVRYARAMSLRRDAIPVAVKVLEQEVCPQRPTGAVRVDDLQVRMARAASLTPAEQRLDQHAGMATAPGRWVGDDIEESDELALEHRDAARDDALRRGDHAEGVLGADAGQQQRMELVAGRGDAGGVAVGVQPLGA